MPEYLVTYRVSKSYRVYIEAEDEEEAEELVSEGSFDEHVANPLYGNEEYIVSSVEPLEEE